jgi:hypothetical protein
MVLMPDEGGILVGVLALDARIRLLIDIPAFG